MTAMGRNTACIEVRLDIRTLARLAKYYQQQNVQVPSKSGLLRLVAEDYAQLLESNKLLPPPLSYTEAEQFLDSIMLDVTRRKVRTAQLTMRSLEEQRTVREDFEPVPDASLAESLRKLD